MREQRLTVSFSADVFHGCGAGVAGVLDRAFLRDFDGVPYLAGSALKGKFRFALLRMLRSLGKPVCAPESERFCREEFCDVCQLFGSPRRRGSVSFADAYPYSPDDSGSGRFYRDWIKESPSILLSGPTHVRATAAINRRTLTVEQFHLFTTEVVESHIQFHSSLKIRGERAEVDLKVLRQTARLVDTFGGGSARGLGYCICEIVDPPAGSLP